MAVFPEAAQDEVEPRDVDLSEERAQFLLVGRGGLVGEQLAAHPVDAPDRDAREEGLVGHPVVRVLVFGDGPLVPEETWTLLQSSSLA